MKRKKAIRRPTKKDLALAKEFDMLGMPYKPASDSCFSLEVDVPDSMGHETHAALQRIKKLVGGNINEFVADRLAYPTEMALCKAMAAEQIDTVAAAIYNIEAYGQGIIIGDQTGIGKGRQAAAIIRYAVAEGKKPIFITEKPNLFSDIYRDLVAIGSERLVPFIVNGRESKTDIKDEEGKVVYQALHQEAQNSVFQELSLPSSFDFIVCTYSQLSGELKKPLKPNFLRAMAKDNILILDEAHNASGSSNTGEFLQKIVAEAKGVAFLSATFAKRPDNMPIYAIKTCIAEANMGKEDLVAAITKGGVALQEILSSQLVAEGQMIRRERTYEGIEVVYKTLNSLEKQHRRTADQITEIIRDIIEFQKTDLKGVFEQMDEVAKGSMSEVSARGGTENAGVDNQPYFSKVFNVINQMLFAVKAEAVADEAILELKAGRKPVIAFSSTMGSFLEEMGVEEGSTVSADFRLVLQKGLDGVLRYTEKDANGKPKYGSLKISELSPEAKRKYYSIQGKIDKVSTGICISPIDIIIQKIQAAGYKVAEVTGRKFELQINPKTLMAVVLNRKKLNTNDAFRMFNNNEVDVLMINQSGSTGASAHAVPTKKVPKEEVKQRVMIVLQAELDINREVQKRGRINRTGQILKPKYIYVSSAIPAEGRLMMMLQKKLKSLDANTSSNQKQSKDILSVPDFLNKYGDKIVMEFLSENLEINLLLDDPLKLLDTDGDAKKERESSPEDAAHRVSGRVAVLSTEMQEKFYNEISERYNDMVEYLKSVNEYDLEVEDMNLEAETVKTKVFKMGKGGRTSFGDDSVLESAMCNVLRKPMTKPEIEKAIRDELKGREPKEIQREIIEALEKFEKERLLKDLKESEERHDLYKKNAPNEKKIKAIEDKTQREQALAERLNEIENAKRANIQKLNNEAMNRLDYLKTFFSSFIIGNGYNYPTLTFDIGASMAKCIFLGAMIDRKRPNPFAPSSVKFKFAVSDSTRYIPLQASGDAAKQLNAIIAASLRLTSYQSSQIFSNWDEITKESNVNRRIRHIVTGNILQAFGDGKGKLVSYTLKGGGVRKGILMPENWQPSDEDRTEVPLLVVENHIKSLRPGQLLSSKNKVISFSRNSSGDLVLMVAGTRQKGGHIFLDNDVIVMTRENNFNKVSDVMRATVPEIKMHDCLVLLQEKHGVTMEVNSNLIEGKDFSKPRPGDVYLELHHKHKNTLIDDLSLMELEAEAIALELELLSFGSKVGVSGVKTKNNKRNVTKRRKR
jgi:hypothetical protein